MRLAHFLLATGIGIAATYAHADIYGYIDAEGTAHFSTEQLDERYQLFMRGNKPFDSSQLTKAEPPAVKTPLHAYLSEHPNLKKYEPLLSDAAKEFNLDPALLKAVMAAESGFNPTAVSPKGAIGLMQVMPATAERYGLQTDKKKTVEQKLTDPKTNIRLGARYLRDLHKMFPAKPDLVIASYNAGEGAVRKYNNKIPPYPETRNYVQVVTQFYKLYKPSSDTVVIANVSAGVSANVSNSASAAKRIRMTIPGRHNMPMMPATTLE